MICYLPTCPCYLLLYLHVCTYDMRHFVILSNQNFLRKHIFEMYFWCHNPVQANWLIETMSVEMMVWVKMWSSFIDHNIGSGIGEYWQRWKCQGNWHSCNRCENHIWNLSSLSLFSQNEKWLFNFSRCLKLLTSSEIPELLIKVCIFF